jgi:hypothetical protein
MYGAWGSFVSGKSDIFFAPKRAKKDEKNVETLWALTVSREEMPMLLACGKIYGCKVLYAGLKEHILISQ